MYNLIFGNRRRFLNIYFYQEVIPSKYISSNRRRSDTKWIIANSSEVAQWYGIIFKLKECCFGLGYQDIVSKVCSVLKMKPSMKHATG